MEENFPAFIKLLYVGGLSGKYPSILISREPVMWPWCNLAASQKRPYCASVNSCSPVGLVSRLWDTIDWACVLCDHRIQNGQASRSASSRQCACLFYSSCAGFLGKAHHPNLSAPVQRRFGSLQLPAFPKVKITIEREVICECDGHTIHELSHWHLAANWLLSQESECSWMHSKVSSDWLPSYVKATWWVLDIRNGSKLSGQPSYILFFNFYLTNCNDNNFIPTYFKNLASVNVFSQTIFQNSVFF